MLFVIEIFQLENNSDRDCERLTRKRFLFEILFFQGIPPRGENPNPLREKIAKINGNVSQQLAEVGNCTFLNIDSALFIGTDGKINHMDMYDYLHFTSKGYQKLCEPLLELVQDLLQEFVKVENTSQDTDSLAGDLASKAP